GGVVGHEQAVVAAPGRGQRDDQDDVGGLLLDGDALAADLVGQARLGGGDAVSPGVSRWSALGSSPRSSTVPVPGSTRLSRNLMIPSWGYLSVSVSRRT